MFLDFISLADLKGDEIVGLMDLADRLKRELRAGMESKPLAGKTFALIFEKPSLRTRVTFETGIFQLGGHGIVLESGQIRLGERESVPDVARNLERWVDGIIARTFSHEAVVALAEHASVPVVNALTDKLHPCQIVADAQTLREHRGDLSSLKLAYVGDGNNVCASWLNFAARVPLNVTVVCPKGYEPDPDIVAFAKREAKGEIVVTQDIEAGLKNSDAVYTDVWASMGDEGEIEQRKKAFASYQVNDVVMAVAKKDAMVMHCLPAHRGEEITEKVLEAHGDEIFEEAENRLHAQKAVLVKLMK